MPEPRIVNRSVMAQPLRLQRSCPKCKKKSSERRDEEERLQMKPVSGASRASSAAQATPSSVPPIVHEVLRSSGQPLDASTRAFMEPRFGHDFGKVRVHADAKAAESARAVNSLGYTVGRDLVFGKGQYMPQAKSGQRLLAHELTHVLQQSATSFSSPSKLLKISDLNKKGELEAEAIVSSIAERHDPKSQIRVTNGSALKLQRLGDLSKIPPGMKCTPAPDDPDPTMFKFDFLFGNEGSNLSTTQEAEIDNVVLNWWLTYGDIRVDGYASTKGRDEINWPLSCDRALAVVNRLQNPKYGLRPIPANAIKYFANGETDKFGSEELNRRAILSVFPVVYVPPTPPPQRTNGVCGPNVTNQVISALSGVRTAFASWKDDQRNGACDAADKVLSGALTSWDILPLFRGSNGWILSYRPACATQGATPPCGSSVQVGNECYYSGTANYVLYGVMCQLCHDHFVATNPPEADRFKEDKMLKNIYDYKGPGSLLGAGANWTMCQEWSKAGYQGWPAGGIPPSPGDKANCSTTCTTPFSPPPDFIARWCPHLNC